MTYNEAYNILTKAGMKVSVSMRKDLPVELLFWDGDVIGWNSFCLINDDGTIPPDAAADILDLYI